MNQTERTLEKLQRRVEEAKERFEKDGYFDLEGQVTEIVIPALKNVLKNLCLKIEERHKVDEPEVGENIDVIHYTSIDALVSMLQQEAKNRQNAAKDEQNATEDKQESSKDEQNASLRLYDSVHFNDPDEGNYFFSNLNLPKKYAWLVKKKESHAYIASFILPDRKKKRYKRRSRFLARLRKRRRRLFAEATHPEGSITESILYHFSDRHASRYTSIKTRIETIFACDRNELTCLASRYTSIKTRIKTKIP